MITVGYGDIVPINTIERIFVVVQCIVACGVFAYSVNAIGSIVSSLTKNKTEFKVSVPAPPYPLASPLPIGSAPAPIGGWELSVYGRVFAHSAEFGCRLN